jgi:putative ABC transport system permease protein
VRFFRWLRWRTDRELDDEIDAHLQMDIDMQVESGLSLEDARQAAHRRFGNRARVKEQARERDPFFAVETVVSDVRYAVRTLRKSPAFSLAAAGTLALGIGATTAIFSVANAALLRPLPYPHAGDIRTLRTRFTDGRVTSGLVGPLELTRLKDPTVPITGAALSLNMELTRLRDDRTPVSVAAAGVDEGFFPLFGLPLTMGTGFTPEHFRQGAPNGAVLSYHVWRDQFGSDPRIVGKSLELVTGSAPIVGVAAPEMDVPRGTDVWLNLQLNPQSTDHSFEGYLRVRQGTTPEALASRLAAVASRLGRDYPGPEGNRAFIVQPFVNAMVGDLRPMLIIVLSATGLLLVLACVNVTNLFLARASRRSREVAIRAALGAGRGRIALQLLIESAVLATAGMLMGVLLAYAGVRVLLLFGASQLPRLETVPFGTPVLLFAVAMLVVSALGVGLAPILHLTGGGIERWLRESGRAVRGALSTHRALRTMIVAEVAVAVTIVAGTGLLVRSFRNLQHEDPGFDARGRLTFEVLLPPARYQNPGVRRAWTETLFTNIRGVRGVTAVAAASDFPLKNALSARPLIQLDGWPESHVVAEQRLVTPEFFDAMGIRLRRGRSFTHDDRQTTAPVAVVNESFVRKYAADRDPLKAQLSFGFPRVDPTKQWSIVGVVNDVKYASLWNRAEPTFYLVQDQSWRFSFFRLSVVVATDAADPRDLAPAISAEVRKMDPQLAFTIVPATSVVASTLARQRLGTTLMLLFGVMALLLAAIGIYGMIAYASAERHSEVATRMALGATPGNIFWLLSRQGLTVAAIGAVAGLGIAYALGRLVSSWLFEVRPSDPLVLASTVALVLGVTLLSTLIPVGRAARISPAVALRSE